MRPSEVTGRIKMVAIRMQAALEQLDPTCRLVFSQFLLSLLFIPLLAVRDGSLIICSLSFDPDWLQSGAAVPSFVTGRLHWGT